MTMVIKNELVVQLFQLVVGFFFGMLIDLNMFLTEWLLSDILWINALVQIAGCTILGIGIAMEVKCGSVTMPGEGITIAIHKVTGLENVLIRHKGAAASQISLP